MIFTAADDMTLVDVSIDLLLDVDDSDDDDDDVDESEETRRQSA